MDWQENYQQRLTTPQEAWKAVRSGDVIVFPILANPIMQLALAARKDELKDVTLRLLAPALDPGWLRLPDESTFKVEFELYIGDFARFVTDERRGTYLPNLFSLGMKAYDQSATTCRCRTCCSARCRSRTARGSATSASTTGCSARTRGAARS